MTSPDEEIDLKDADAIEELSGKLGQEQEEEKLMRTVLDNDTNTIDQGKLVVESYNQGISSFSPDIIFEKLTQNYSFAEKLYGQRLIQLLSGYDPNYIKKNIRIPEFQRELKAALGNNVKNLKREQVLDTEGTITSKGIFLASLVLYTEELDHLIPKGFLGKKEHKSPAHDGIRDDPRPLRQHDRFRDIDIRKTLKTAIQRNHTAIEKEDFQVSTRKAKGNIEIIYALDASGSMRGKKIETAKKAGIALAFKAIENRDKVGLLIFGADIKEEVPPTHDFHHLLQKMTVVKAAHETNMAATIEKAALLFSRKSCTKHVIILTDAMPTVGDNPERETLKAVSNATVQGITTSLLGIGLDKDGKKLAKRMIEISKGRLYTVSDLDSVDTLILQDYYEAK